jgi:hypothetical protein
LGGEETAMRDARLERKLDCLIADLDSDGLVFAEDFDLGGTYNKSADVRVKKVLTDAKEQIQKIKRELP